MNDSQIKSTILAAIARNGGSAINADLVGALDSTGARVQARRIVRCANELASAGLVKMSEGTPNGFGQRKVTWHAV